MARSFILQNAHRPARSGRSDAQTWCINGFSRAAAKTWFSDSTQKFSGIAKGIGPVDGQRLPPGRKTEQLTGSARAILRPLVTATALTIAMWVTAQPVTAQSEELSAYYGMCDASAAVSVGGNRFVVANDEDNILRIYRQGVPTAEDVDLRPHLKAQKESDIEGAARLGERIYWISSHGNNSSGERQQRRHRLFAVEIETNDGRLSLRPADVASQALSKALLDPKLADLKLAAAEPKAPEAGGINIEGLGVGDNGSLLLGLRSPLVEGRAIVLRLSNPAEVVSGSADPDLKLHAKLDLGGRGIRSLEKVSDGYLVVGGPTGDVGEFKLYHWSETAPDGKATLLAALNRRPEALFIDEDGRLNLLSDDGAKPTTAGVCKESPIASRRFEGWIIDLPNAGSAGALSQPVSRTPARP